MAATTDPRQVPAITPEHRAGRVGKGPPAEEGPPTVGLPRWQERLTAHFRALRRQRSEVAGDRPIFALEHGLTSTEVDELQRDVRAHIVTARPENAHTFPWLVYAAEVGYLYSGDEYWQTFEAQTPGWTVHGERTWLRDRFEWFHRELLGAKPSGRWAEWFRNICWPIANAILPVDLQRQLARILYDLRTSYSAELFDSPAKLGARIAARAAGASSRFQKLAEQTELIGQIAAALLLPNDASVGTLIEARALKRIVERLEQERAARGWLRDARRHAEEKRRLRGLVRPARGPQGARDDQRETAAALAIEPWLLLRPAAPDQRKWDVFLEIPAMARLAERFPAARDIIAGARCVVAGSPRPLARGVLLDGARVPLAKWPRPGEVLLRFEHSAPELDALLKVECLLRPGPRWLFRVASDGFAYEVRGATVRPGRQYVLITDSPSLPAVPGLGRVGISCEGVSGALLELAKIISPEQSAALLKLGVSTVQTIEAWPVGVPPVRWDGDARAEWLFSERPSVAIRADHALTGLEISLGGTDPLRIPGITPGECIFVELPALDVGTHTVRLTAKSGPESVDAEFVAVVREARAWQPGASRQSAVTVQPDPASPTLEQLWEGQAGVEVRGPSGAQMSVEVALKSGENILVRRRLPPIAMPVPLAAWHRYFSERFRNAVDAQAAYDRATACEISFVTDDATVATLHIDREYAPLRWVLSHHRHGGRYQLELVDEGSDPATLMSYRFETPDVPDPVAAEGVIGAAEAGGLYSAKRDSFETAILVPPVSNDLRTIAQPPRLARVPTTVEHAVALLSTAASWSRARQPGTAVVDVKRRQAVQLLTRGIFAALAGQEWYAAEARCPTYSPAAIADLKRSVSTSAEGRGFAAALSLNAQEFANVPTAARAQRFAEMATRFLAEPTRSRLKMQKAAGIASLAVRSRTEQLGWLSEFALRLASSPRAAADWAKGDGPPAMQRLREQPVLARAARFLVLAVDAIIASRPATAHPSASWEWS